LPRLIDAAPNTGRSDIVSRTKPAGPTPRGAITAYEEVPLGIAERRGLKSRSTQRTYQAWAEPRCSRGSFVVVRQAWRVVSKRTVWMCVGRNLKDCERIFAAGNALNSSCERVLRTLLVIVTTRELT